MLSVLNGIPSESTAIIYTTFTRDADELAAYLFKNGVRAASYHAGKQSRVSSQ